MSQTSGPATYPNHLETRQSPVMDILQPKAANDLQQQRTEQRDYDPSGHLTPSLDNQELTSIISSLAHNRKGLRQEVNELKLQVTEFPREPTPVQRDSPLLDTSQVNFLKTSAAAEGKGLIQASPETAHCMTLKDLN